MSQANKRARAGLGLGIGLLLLSIVVAAVVTNGFTRFPWAAAPGTSSTTSPAPTQAGFSAYCGGSSVTPAGIYPAGPGSTSPAGCLSMPQLISVTVTDLFNSAKSLSAAYSCVFYYNTGAPATFSILGQGVQINGGTWTVGPGVQASSSGVCAPANWTPSTGTQVVVKVCIDASATCVQGDYTPQKTVVYCPLPSAAPNTVGQTCGPGPAWGSVPYTQQTSSNAPTFLAAMSIIMIAGQNPTGSNSGYNTATPILLDERYQNGTDFTSANTCLVNTGANACDLPKASSQGTFTMNWAFTTGGAGTAPTNPAGSGYMSSFPIDLQTGPLARGSLQLVLSVEIKATTHSDMCSITSPTLFGPSGPAATILQKSGSATDVFYLYVLNEQALTKVTDPTGVVLNPGALSTSVQLNCGAVYNGSGDVVTITPIIYGYFSLKYFQAPTVVGNSLNPENAVLSQSAVITIDT